MNSETNGWFRRGLIAITQLLRHPFVKRLEAVVCTGSPGLYRVITFFAVQHIYSLSELGRSASSMSVAQMAGFFTAIGWATLILVRVPGAKNEQAAIDSFYRLVSMAAITSFVVTAAGIALALSGLVRFDVWAFISLLWGWTVYQVARNYFVAHKRYRISIAFDVALIVGSGVLLWLCRQSGLSSSVALAAALGGVALAMFIAIGLPSRDTPLLTFDIKGLQFGLTNFLSGGISLIFVPAATTMCGASFAGTLSLLASVTNVGILMPRAIVLAQLADLAKRKSTGFSLDGTLRMMRRSIGWCNAIILVVNVVLVLALVLHQIHGADERQAAIIAGLLLSVLCLVGMMGMTNSSIMIVFEKGGETAKINIGTTSAFALLFVCFFWYGGQTGFMLILVSAVVVTLWRNWLIRCSALVVHREYIRLHAHAGQDGSSGQVLPLQAGAQQ